VCAGDKCERDINAVTAIMKIVSATTHAVSVTRALSAACVCLRVFNGSLHFPSVGVDDNGNDSARCRTIAFATSRSISAHPPIT